MTVWFIDDSWELKKKIIQLENDEMGVDLLERVKRWFLDWNIDKRILSIAAKNIDNGIFYLAYAYRYASKVIELKNWLNERVPFPFIWNTCPNFLRHYVNKVRYQSSHLVYIEAKQLEDYYVKSSNKYKFELAVKKVESIGKKVTSKNNDRFPLPSSDLLDWVIGCKEAFCELEHTDPGIKSIKFNWYDATSVQSFLAVLNEVSKIKLANEFFPLLLKMLKFVKNGYYLVHSTARLCGELLDKTNMVFVITVILDPRFKMDIVEHFCKEFHDNEADLHSKKIIDDVSNIYNEYAKDVNNSSMVRQYAFPNEVASSKSELNRYLTDSKVPLYEEFDILEWWRVNSPTYPTLAMMARDFLSIPISEPFLPTHFDYSLKNEVENIYTGGLDDDLKNALVCSKVWLKDPANV
ncbi:zinc finger BED domain-containing protein RICESLEEPER 3-like [Mangifera indica]|uniref:zinc finger BED domain-containing protein RICESLEEPER 3-like n=1 Tax=Mangifera indica TaxID=29780 RepID=UPI001CF99321|nr:zinc finger BED domain-containing protein RICESLEEPER 3-like [Mangifera indica]